MTSSQPIIGDEYKHWKTGDIYRVKGIATHTETEERLVVYVRAMGGDVGPTWARPLSSWNKPVETVEGGSITRFEHYRTGAGNR